MDNVFFESKSNLSEAMDNFERLYQNFEITESELRQSFCEVSYQAKLMLALMRLGTTSLPVEYEEEEIIALLADLELRPICHEKWFRNYERFKCGLHKISEDEKIFFEDVGEYVPVLDEIYVGGQDRVTEGEGEIDFDIPESSIFDQVRDEVAYLANELRKRRAG